MDLGSIRFVEINQIRLILRTLGEDAVCFLNNALFNLKTLVREIIHPSLELTANTTQRMERDYEGNVQSSFEVYGHQSRHPKISMDQIIWLLLPFEKIDHILCEGWHVTQ